MHCSVLISFLFQVGKVHCRVPVEGGRREVRTDLEAILADFQLMGEGLVKSVELLAPN